MKDKNYMNIKNFADSTYAKRYAYPVIDTRKDDKGEDIVLFWYAMTARHAISKHKAIMRIPKEEFPNGIPMDTLMEKAEKFRLPSIRRLKSGKYIWSRPLLYSGKVIA